MVFDPPPPNRRQRRARTRMVKKLAKQMAKQALAAWKAPPWQEDDRIWFLSRPGRWVWLRRLFPGEAAALARDAELFGWAPTPDPHGFVAQLGCEASAPLLVAVQHETLKWLPHPAPGAAATETVVVLRVTPHHRARCILPAVDDRYEAARLDTIAREVERVLPRPNEAETEEMAEAARRMTVHKIGTAFVGGRL